MKKDFPEKIERYRVTTGPLRSIKGFGFNGAFEIPYRKKTTKTMLFVVVSDQCGWDHVSISTAHRCPTYNEMKYIKDLFWDGEETVVQFFPKKSQYVNKCPFCLHLWKKQGADYDLPPQEFVG
jgi:hypothetical protein